METRALVEKHVLNAKKLLKKGQFSESTASLKRILDIDLYSPEAYKAVKKFVWQLHCGETKEIVILETIQCIQDISRKLGQQKGWPDDETLQWLHNLGITMIRNEQWHTGLKCLDFVMKKGRLITGVHYARSVALFNMKRFQEARKAAWAELDIRPEHKMARKILKSISQAKELDVHFFYSNNEKASD